MEIAEGIGPVKEMIEDYFDIVGEGAAVKCTVLKQIAEGGLGLYLLLTGGRQPYLGRSH